MPRSPPNEANELNELRQDAHDRAKRLKANADARGPRPPPGLELSTGRSLEPLLSTVDTLCATRGVAAQCPWSAARTTGEFLPYLSSEIEEVQEALEDLRLSTDEERQRATQHLTAELGDLLFDALMAVRLAERDHEGVTLEAVALVAARKVKGRTPYVAAWRRSDAPSAGSEQEAMRHWSAAKNLEPEHTDPWRPEAAVTRLWLRLAAGGCALAALVALLRRT